MGVKTTYLKIRYILIKIFIYLPEIIIFYFSKKFTKIYFLSDNAGWASDRTTASIYEMARENKFDCKWSINHPRNQFVFYGDQYSLLSKNVFNYNNKISFDYEHGLSKYSLINKKLLNIVHNKQNKISLIRVTNSFFKNYLIENGISPKKIRQIPLTVNRIFREYDNYKKLKIKRYLNIPENKFIIGSFHKDGDGFDKGLVPKLIKGPDIFLKCLKQIENKQDLFVLLTAPGRGYIKKGLQKLGIEYKHCEVKNFNDLPDYYNVLDLYLIASRDEGGPTGLFESMACGVPVISTKVGLAIDFVEDGKNGFLVDVEDYQKMSDCLQLLINDKSIKDKIKRNCAKTVAKQFKNEHKKIWKKFFNEFLEYKNCK